jgi:hypothetical protein
MRTFAWLVPIPFVARLIVWAYNEVANAYLGLGFIGLMLLCIIVLAWAIRADFEEFTTNRRIKEDEL